MPGLGAAAGAVRSAFMWIYGRNPVLEALQQGSVEEVLLANGVEAALEKRVAAACRTGDVPFVRVPRIALDRALSTTGHQGIAARLPELVYADVSAATDLAAQRGEPLLLVVLDEITDPRNYGAIVRSAEALGAHGVVTEKRRSAPTSAVMAKAAAGAALRLPLIQVTNLPTFLGQRADQGAWIYGTAADGTSTPSELDWARDVVLVIGSEGHGMRRIVRERCDEIAAIPLHGRATSLNASVAASIVMYEASMCRASARIAPSAQNG